MKYAAKIEVSLKPGHSNPEGETTARLLIELGYKVEAVDVSKVYTNLLLLAQRSQDKSGRSEQTPITNPTKDNYTITSLNQMNATYILNAKTAKF
jgi:phosphoribosylformylglycinamidine (FGAM) synthase PurS component